MRKSVGVHRKQVGVVRAMRWRLLAVAFGSWSKPAHAEEWVRCDIWWCSPQWLQLCSANAESRPSGGSSEKGSAWGLVGFFCVMKPRPLQMIWFKETLPSFWSICRTGKRGKGQVNGQLAVLKIRRGALVTTPQKKADMWLDKCVGEFGGGAVVSESVSECVIDEGDIPTCEAGYYFAHAHPRTVMEWGGCTGTGGVFHAQG